MFLFPLSKMFYSIFQILITIISCIIFVSCNRIDFNTASDVNDIANNLWNEFRYLGLEQLKFAVYEYTNQHFQMYQTDGKVVEKMNIEYKGSDQMYDIPTQSFVSSEKYLEPPEIKLVGNYLEISHPEGVVKTYANGLTYKDGLLRFNKSCTDGVNYPVTMSEYKRYYNTPSNSMINDTLPNLYFKCENGERIIQECQAGSKFDGENCILDNTPLSAPLVLRLHKVPRDVTSFINIKNNEASVVYCGGGVDTSLVECRDRRCFIDTGSRFTRLKTGAEQLAPRYRKNGVITCEKGKVVNTVHCNGDLQTLLITANEFIVFQHIHHYPKEYYSPRLSSCQDVTLDMLQLPVHDFDTFSYLAASNTFQPYFTNNELKWVQRFENIKEGLIVPDISNPRRFFQMVDKVVTQINTTNQAVVYKNVIYETSLILPDLNYVIDDYISRVVLIDDVYYTRVGNVIMDMLVPSPELEKAGFMVIESYSKAYDDFYHKPLGLAYVLQVGEQFVRKTYKNVNTVYNIPNDSHDDDRYKQMIDFYQSEAFQDQANLTFI